MGYLIFAFLAPVTQAATQRIEARNHVVQSGFRLSKGNGWIMLNRCQFF